MHEESFGARLRAERERRRITLESIAANTKISIALLRDLESDRVSHWPGGIFRRSFLKSYAVAIGLDPDDTLQEFLERYPDRSSAAATSDSTERPDAPQPRRPFRPRASLRLVLADEPTPVVPVSLVALLGRRVIAAVVDAGAPAAMAGLAFLAIGTFWAPFGIALLVYAAIGTVVLGMTPGMYLLATIERSNRQPRSGEKEGERGKNEDDDLPLLEGVRS